MLPSIVTSEQYEPKKKTESHGAFFDIAVFLPSDIFCSRLNWNSTIRVEQKNKIKK